MFPTDPKSTKFVDLESTDYRLNDLKHCSSINSLIEDYLAPSDGNILLFDLSPSDCPIPNSFTISSPATSVSSLFCNHTKSSLLTANRNLHKIHLSLPTTLLKRPKFTFANMLQTLFTKEKKDSILNLIANSSIFIFYDRNSVFDKCTIQTYLLIKKFQNFLDANVDYQLILLSSDEPFTQDKTVDTKEMATTIYNREISANGQQYSLTINIPTSATNKSFIRSIKKINVNYSPNSLKKYFDFNIPDNLLENDNCLPEWLRQFTIKSNHDKILSNLYHKFQLLEDLEIERLSKCLIKEEEDKQQRMDSSYINELNQSFLQSSSSYHKIYSLHHLQKQFKKRKQDNLNDKRVPALLVTTEVNESHASISDTNSSTPLSEGDVLLTPLDNYAVSKGIQSFNKNRYSNIVPYEHSRVKLAPSPILNGNGESICSSDLDQGPLDNNNNITDHRMKNQRYPSPNDMNNQKGFNVPSSSLSISSAKSNSISTNPPTSEGSSIGQKSQVADDTLVIDDYFNANYLSIPQINPDYTYVATQAPLPTTIDDFWNVIISNNINVIVSLNSDDELHMKKWDIYWDNPDNSNLKHKYNVKLVTLIENFNGIDGFVLRIFRVNKKDKDNFSIIYQLHYTKWLDSCVVDVSELLKLFQCKDSLLQNPLDSIERSSLVTQSDKKRIKNLTKLSENYTDEGSPMNKSPLLVHCSAGCGRTGVFITLDILTSILSDGKSASNEVDVWNMKQDLLFIIINELRKQRLSMVQNLSQFVACYESIFLYFALLKEKLK
ncbi:hypothetical protein KAFR_0H02710 [Kazachstania africana CBS 2517]|uniref:Tyrosine specific protein phosphatases domain-containing protein n=1 Tax=Kazachstania africana (strain ATCC 22294 / BCRC 22015 / CBS 2517 / CECT 1963 / NBRC 1671 / NRRL Y-8276) TaxID=1071382 RepID=H2AZC4_KAZAF|nr:hypothetical protein KAFR_0H02710 [Kazachstania africana CBS 2517]CCF59680.1 hypothetical protein KAFR_0H02710 [Kazachstania africana CBS 2517]